MKLAPEADKWTLLRRVTLDLTGVPPSLAEMDAFSKDASPDAYSKVVDRLLHSPRYGEHMASQWLDFARYAGGRGFLSCGRGCRRAIQHFRTFFRCVSPAFGAGRGCGRGDRTRNVRGYAIVSGFLEPERAALSWPQPAATSMPRLCLIVLGMPACWRTR